MTTITKERLQEIASHEIGADNYPLRAEWQEMARMLLAGMESQPVALSVWYGAMPETNGKTNWTAILHRKGENAWYGITIDRSEYPDRTRYEADRMRYLIGEISEEPDCLDYDADKHSGYIAPQPAPVVPGALPESDDEDGNDIDYLEPSEVYALGRAAGWNACRAAMLNGGKS